MNSPQNTHRDARTRVTLRTLFEDGHIREGHFISKGPLRSPVLTRPRFRNNLLDGATGIWDILRWLMADTGPTLCLELSKGSGEFRPGNLATLVLQNATQRKEFKTLYHMHCSLPMATHLVAPEPNSIWDFDIKSVINNPFALLVYKNAKSFVSSLQFLQAAIEPRANLPNTRRQNSSKMFLRAYGFLLGQFAPSTLQWALSCWKGSFAGWVFTPNRRNQGTPLQKRF